MLCKRKGKSKAAKVAKIAEAEKGESKKQGVMPLV
jgi:hypothetical protein